MRTPLRIWGYELLFLVDKLTFHMIHLLNCHWVILPELLNSRGSFPDNYCIFYSRTRMSREL